MVGQRVTPEELLGPLGEVEKKHAPKELFVAGDVSLLTKRARVSIVGSRKASPAGLKRAAKLAAMLVERGVVVVSGLAEGIDTAAPTAAIELGGRTVAVLGTPLDECFPAGNQTLQDRVHYLLWTHLRGGDIFRNLRLDTQVTEAPRQFA